MKPLIALLLSVVFMTMYAQITVNLVADASGNGRYALFPGAAGCGNLLFACPARMYVVAVAGNPVYYSCYDAAKHSPLFTVNVVSQATMANADHRPDVWEKGLNGGVAFAGSGLAFRNSKNFDRGHMTTRSDVNFNAHGSLSTSHVINRAAQSKYFNENTWMVMEKAIQKFAKQTAVCVMTYATFRAAPKTEKEQGAASTGAVSVAIPNRMGKVIFDRATAAIGVFDASNTWDAQNVVYPQPKVISATVPHVITAGVHGLKSILPAWKAMYKRPYQESIPHSHRNDCTDDSPEYFIVSEISILTAREQPGRRARDVTVLGTDREERRAKRQVNGKAARSKRSPKQNFEQVSKKTPVHLAHLARSGSLKTAFYFKQRAVCGKGCQNPSMSGVTLNIALPFTRAMMMAGKDPNDELRAQIRKAGVSYGNRYQKKIEVKDDLVKKWFGKTTIEGRSIAYATYLCKKKTSGSACTLDGPNACEVPSSQPLSASCQNIPYETLRSVKLDDFASFRDALTKVPPMGVEGLASRYIAAVIAYSSETDQLYRKINCYLTNPKASETQPTPLWVTELKDLVLTVLNKARSHDKITYRACTLPIQPVKDDILKNLGFLGTAADPKYALAFKECSPCYRLELDNADGRFLNQFTSSSIQSEILVKPDQCWRVIEIQPSSAQITSYFPWAPSQITPNDIFVKLTRVPCTGSEKNILESNGEYDQMSIANEALGLDTELQEITNLIE